MAVIDGEDGIEVQILCDGQPLHEYEDSDVGKIPGTTTKYVVAETGCAFVIRCTFKTEFRFRGNAVICEVLIDGKKVTGKLVPVAECKLQNCVCDLTGARTSPTTIRSFTFSDLIISELCSFCDLKLDLLTKSFLRQQLELWNPGRTPKHRDYRGESEPCDAREERHWQSLFQSEQTSQEVRYGRERIKRPQLVPQC
jgi:hypothetical protein